MTASNSKPEGAVSRRIRLFGLAAALAVAALLTSLGDAVSRPVFDLWQKLSPRDSTPSRVEIVWVDEASIRTIGPWPWSRYMTAKLIAKLAEDQPQLIGIDMLFPEGDRNGPDAFVKLYPELAPGTAAEIRALPSMDRLFGQVIGQAPVVLGRGGLDAEPLDIPPAAAVEARFTGPLPEGVKSWGQAILNIPALDDVGLGHGLLNGDPDSDGTVRYVPLVASVAGQATPGFALELARIASGVEAIEPIVARGDLKAVKLGKTILPTLPDGRMRVPFRKTARSEPVSALDILYDLPPSKRVKGKIVIVGLSGAGTADVVSTPLDGKTYGAIVHADAIQAILDDKPLYRPGWAWIFEGALAVLLVAFAIRLMPRLRGIWPPATAIAVTAAVFAGSWLAFVNGLLIDPVSPLLTAAATGSTMIVLLYDQSRRDRRALGERLEEQKLVAAKASGELSAARDIQLGMLPAREGMAGFDPSVELDALLEPARSIGGDFYDTMRLSDGRIAFLVGDVTGKGVPAALFMALSKALTKSVLLRDGHDLAAAMTRLNDEIARDNSENMLVTMLVGVLDPKTGALELCNAGHENPWLVTAGGAVSQIKPDGGPPLCVMPGYRYDTEIVELARGDALVIVSDGISEAQSPDGGFFGSERIAKTLETWRGTGGVARASDALLEQVRLFEDGADATDDLTVLVFRYLT